MEEVSTRHNYRTRLFFYSLSVVVLGAVVAGAGVLTLLPSRLGDRYDTVISTLQGIESVLLQKVVLLYLVIVVGIAAAMIVLHLVYSHRVAGPAFALGREGRKIGDGRLAGNIKFRQKDNLTDMADSLNEVAASYRGRLDGLRSRLGRIETRTEAVLSLLREGKDPSALEQPAGEIADQIKEINAILSEMRT